MIPLLATAEASHAAAALHPTLPVLVPWLFLIPLFPLLGAVVNGLFGLRLQRRFGKPAVHAVAVAAVAASWIDAIGAFVVLLRQPEESRYLLDRMWTFIDSGALHVDFAFAIDPLSMTMVLVVTTVGGLIHVYSTGYMADDPDYWRFFFWLNLFMFAMLLLVMGDSFVLMFFGWEGVGLCSWGLIGFWYKDLDKAKAGLKAFVVNRIGDFGFLAGLLLLFWSLGATGWNRAGSVKVEQGLAMLEGAPAAWRIGAIPQNPVPVGVQEAMEHGDPTAPLARSIRPGPTLTFRELRDQIVLESTGVANRLKNMTFLGLPVLFLVGLFLFVGAAGKSAQIPLYVWLPDAMAGPTPVSALIHAATMVTAGVYMVARLNFIFVLSPGAMTVVAVTGVATALFAASIGFFQHDIKKVLAYSTVSQLGFMFVGVGVGAYWAGIYHLVTHAFFKACLFLGSGSVILGCHHEQDMRKMGGLKKFMPITERTYWYACVAISGFPIASGFFSKDEILWKAFSSHLPFPGWIIWLAGWIAATGTSYYMWRSYYMTFTGEYRGGHGHGAHAGDHAHDAAHAIAAPAGAHRSMLPALSLGAAAAGDPAIMGADEIDDQVTGSAPAHDPDHAHSGGVPHESPASMTYVLAILAFGAMAMIGIGLWGPLGITPALEHWLNPVVGPAQETAFPPGEHHHAWVEWLLMCLSVAVAFAGWAVARFLYRDAKNPLPAQLAQGHGTAQKIWQVIYHKYYIDEIYFATVVRGTLGLRSALYWIDRNLIDGCVNMVGAAGRGIGFLEGSFDKYVVDGAVNLVGAACQGLGRTVRRVQTGNIQAYLAFAISGAFVFVLVSYLVRGR